MSPVSPHRQAVLLLQAGQRAEAVRALRELVAAAPDNVHTRHDLAVALASLAELREAVAHLEQVVQQAPNFVEAWGNLGKLLGECGRHEEAAVALQRFLESKPDQPEAWLCLSASHRARRQFPEAVTALRQALKLRPDLVEGWLKLGVLLAQTGQAGEAETSYREALRLRPLYPEALNNLGVLLREQGRHPEAEVLFQRALELRPGTPKTLLNLGVAYAEQGKDAQAWTCCEEVLKLQPHSHEAHNNLGNLLLRQGRYDEAVARFQRALQVKPDYAEAYNNLGLAFGHKGLLHQAVAFFDQALHWQPALAAVHLNKAIHCLAAGDFEPGWREYEWRWRTGKIAPRSFSQPQWDGAPLAGRTILLHTEQGFGDTFQFIRYAEQVRQRGGTTIVLCPRTLTPILSSCRGIDRLVAEEEEELPPFDVHISLLSLPRLFRTTLSSVPSVVPYLTPRADLVSHWRGELEKLPGRRVGIAWQGSPRYVNDRARSIPLDRFAPLATVPEVQLISLQKGPGEEQLSAVKFPVVHFGQRLDESTGPFLDTAAILSQLDLLITSDNAVAHLAGALACPVWLLLNDYPDWRWLRDRADSPWYPTMRLFRQRRPGDWDEVFGCVAEALSERVGSGGGLVSQSPSPVEVGAQQPRTESPYDRAMALVGRQEHGEALIWFRQAVAQQPDSFDAWHNLGVTQIRKGQLDDAVTSFTQALTLQPGSAAAHNNLGLVHLQKGRHAEAVLCFRKALTLNPNLPEFHNNLATAHLQLRQTDEAIAAYRRALDLRGDLVDARRNLGFAYRLKKEYDKARACYQEAVRLRPDAAELHNDLGITFLQEGRLEEALPSFENATRCNPKLLDAWNNWGVCLSDLNRLDEAIRTLEQGLEQVPGHPETHRNLAILRLMQGDWERGFREFEWRWQCARSGQRNFSRPLWDGSDLHGKTILLHAEQGLGDTLQFIRFAATVQERGGTVIVECQKSLVGLLTRCAGIDQLVARGDPLPPFDVQAPFLSLPALLGTTPANLPNRVPYLFPDPELVDYWGAELADQPQLQIGIAWQGNPKYGGDRHRSLPLAHFQTLMKVPNVRLVSLQKGFGCEQIARLTSKPRLQDLDRRLDNQGGFQDTAAVLMHLDLVITSDTALAHLAGGLGLPVWVALGFNCDWRWQRQGETSPWYPNMRLFRQNQPGNWEEVFARLREELAVFARQRGHSGLPAPISPGELLDKLSILEIKLERIKDPEKQHHVHLEHVALQRTARRYLTFDKPLLALAAELKQLNERLWQIEDDLRDCEQHQDFGPGFIALARAVYHENDRRAAIKRCINSLLGSRLVEEKSYRNASITDCRMPEAQLASSENHLEPQEGQRR